MASSTVITDAFLERETDGLVSAGATLDIAYFKIGEGGWVLDGATRVQRDPDPTLTDLDCIENPNRYGASERFYFRKNIAADKITRVDGTTVRIECVVDATEANVDDDGLAPEFWELAIFASDDTMISHTTFSRQPKTDQVMLRHRITISRAMA